jgi:hypothetical protein
MKHSLLLPLLFCLATVAHAQHRHTHGEGRLDAVIDKDSIALTLELPLDAAVGFERAPKNDQEKAALATVGKILNDAATLFTPTSGAGCTVQSVQVHLPFTGGNDKHGHHAHEGETHHADIEASYIFRCAHPAALKGIETTLFRQFRRMYRLEAQRAGPSGQGKQRLTPKNPVLNW